jgi:hypothetical protein
VLFESYSIGRTPFETKPILPKYHLIGSLFSTIQQN